MPTLRLPLSRTAFDADDGALAAKGYKLFREGREVGHICSGAVSPTIGKHIGSAYLPVELAQVGETVDMDIRGKLQTCTVVEMPFYSRTR